MLNLISFSPTSKLTFTIKYFNSLCISDFAAYAPESENSMDELNDQNQHAQQQQNLTDNKIPSLMSLSITPPIITKSTHEKPTASISIVKEK